MYSVLCVDDQETILRSLQREFMYESFETFFAQSGAEAISLMEEKEISVIVADMKMSGMDGLRLLRIVKERWPLTVRVVLSGYLYLPQMLAAINGAYIYQFITKPWGNRAELLDVLYRSIDYHKERKAEVLLRQSLEARNVTYQNIIKKVNQSVSDSKQARDMLGWCGKDIFATLSSLASIDVQKGEWEDILLVAKEVFENLLSLSSLECVLVEVQDVLERIQSGIEALDSVDRLDVGVEAQENYSDDVRKRKLRVKMGLIEYCVCNLIRTMLPGVKKYVKFFINECSKKDVVNFIVIVSPVHRFDEEGQNVKLHSKALYKSVLERILSVFGGEVEVVNKGTKYLVSIELKLMEREDVMPY